MTDIFALKPLNIAYLRTSAHVLRLVSILFAPAFIFNSESELANYLWFITLLTVAPLFLSLEFYTYSNRYYLKNKSSNNWSKLTLSSLIVVSLSVVIFSPLIIFLVTTDGFTLSMCVYVILIIYIDALLNEVQKFKILQNKQVISNLIYLIRQFDLLILLALDFFSILIFFDSIKYLLLVRILILFIFTPKSGYGKVSYSELSFFIKNGIKPTIKMFTISSLNKVNNGLDRLILIYLLNDSMFIIYTYIMIAINTIASYVEPLINQLTITEFYKGNRDNIFKRDFKRISLFCLLGSVIFLVYFFMFLSNLTDEYGLALCGVLLIFSLSFQIYLRFIAYLNSYDNKNLMVSLANMLGYALVFSLPSIYEISLFILILMILVITLTINYAYLKINEISFTKIL